MKKSIVAALFLGMSVVVSSPAVAESLVHRDNSPKTCKMEVAGEVQATCEQFVIIESNELRYFVFNFGGTPITFIAPEQPFKSQPIGNFGATADAYYAPMMVIGDERTEVQVSCVWAEPHSALFGGMASCSRHDIENDVTLTYYGNL